MQFEADIPLPIKFNAHKHHLHYIMRSSLSEPDRLPDNFCNNYTDVYTGNLSPAAIAYEILVKLEDMELLNSPGFEKAMLALTGFFILTLSDNSQWIIRKGDSLERYIHIHPARSGEFTRRFKGATLHTSLLLFQKHQGSTDALTLKNVNQVRMLANLPPIKKLEKSKSIGRCYFTLLQFAEELNRRRSLS